MGKTVNKLLHIILISIIFSFSFAVETDTNSSNPTVDNAFKLEFATDSNGVKIDFNVNKNVYVYKDSLKVYVNDSEISTFLNYPLSKEHKGHNIYDGVKLFVPFGLIMSNGNLDDFNIRIKFNACSYGGFCYEPQDRIFGVYKIANGYNIKQIQSAANSNKNILDSENNEYFNTFNSSNVFMTLITFFGYGLLLSLTPCTFPMIPILSGIIISKAGNKRRLFSNFMISLVYVLAMAFSYSIMGFFIALFGSNLQAVMQTPVVIIGFSIVFFVLSLSMFGAYEITIPTKLQNFLGNTGKNLSGYLGVFVMGFFSSIVVSPCVAAPLAGAFLYIADTKDVILGASALFALGFAMGVPLLLIGLGSTKLLPKPGFWMNEIKNIFGFLMIFMAIWMLSRIISENYTMLLYSIFCFVVAFYFNPFSLSKQKLVLVKNGFLYFILVYGIILLIGFAAGNSNALKPLENFKTATSLNSIPDNKFNILTDKSEIYDRINNSKKPVILDFWANWCVECKEVDRMFSDKLVSEKMAHFNVFKVDLSDSDTNRILMKEFGIFGPPSILFFNNSKEIKELRINGVTDLDTVKFIEILDKILQKY